ncbi:MAG: hypothetical protein KAT43_04830 [Nanoarchaeota archaeon]|nr:hypothetical protein [Nanoarchaeota archaeon]
MIKGHRIEKKEEIETFLERIRHYTKDQIECTKHTFFRLSEKQRKIFKSEDIKRILLESTPLLVGIQFNGNYATFYKFKENKIIRIALDIIPQKIEVVTFMILDKYQVPRL